MFISEEIYTSLKDQNLMTKSTNGVTKTQNWLVGNI